MAHIEEHLKDTEKHLDRSWPEVHKFLDQHAGVFPVVIFLDYHRTFLHNKRGLALVQHRWGAQAEQAAVIHLVRDYRECSLIDRSLDWINKQLGKALIAFNHMETCDPQLLPDIINGWGGKSLCYIAFEQHGYDEYYRNLKDL